LYVFLFCLIFWGTTYILNIKLYLAHLIKEGTVLRRTLWGANTFPTRNRLPIPNLVSKTILFKVFLLFFIINYGGDSSVPFLNYFRHPAAISVATDGDSTRDRFLESILLVECAKCMSFLYICVPLVFCFTSCIFIYFCFLDVILTWFNVLRLLYCWNYWTLR